MSRWPRGATLLDGFVTVSDCVSELAATVAVLSLPPVVEITVMGCNKYFEIYDLCALRRSVIVIHTHPAVWHLVYSSGIIDIKLAGLHGSDEVNDAHRAPCELYDGGESDIRSDVS